MLHKVEIENFFSIGKRQEIDLRARKSVRDDLGRLSPLFSGSQDRVPNVVALFGPNASGKSNVLRAIAFARWFATKSFENSFSGSLPYMKFGSEEQEAKPTRLCFSFSAPIDFRDASNGSPTCPYSYELVLAQTGKELNTVTLERLSFQPRGFGKPTTIIERRGTQVMRYAKSFMSAQHKWALQAILRSDASAICTLAQLNHEVSATFVKWISGMVSNILVERFEGDEEAATLWYVSNPSGFNQLQEIGKRIDLGIEQIEMDESSPEPQLQFHHAGLDRKVALQLESHGTREFIKLFPFVQMALERGSVAIIDDIDSAIHPLLLPEIVRWFGDEEKNPRGAQLWMTCHATSLLLELTKEEVLFCEKDSKGQTTVFKLVDVERVRRDENYFGKYMGGEYGAVPNIG